MMSDSQRKLTNIFLSNGGHHFNILSTVPFRQINQDLKLCAHCTQTENATFYTQFMYLYSSNHIKNSFNIKLMELNSI